MRKASSILVIAILSTTGLAWAGVPALRQPVSPLLRIAWLGYFYFANPTITSITGSNNGSPAISATDPDGAAPSGSVAVNFTVPKNSGRNLVATLSVTSATTCGGIPISPTDITVACTSATGSTTITCGANQSLSAGGTLASSNIIHGNGVQTFTVNLSYTFADSWAKKAGSCTLPLTYTVDVQ